MQSTWKELSRELSETVAHAGRSVVAVDGRGGHTSSGIRWRRGYVLTAAHAIRQEGNIGIIAEAGKSARAQLAGRDTGTDIALLKLDQDLEPAEAEFGDTASLRVGELVVAIGRTRRGNIVASAGILSGLMGEWTAGRTRIDQFIRPDLMLYPGFSGGALLGAGGKLLGMNSGGLLRGKPITLPSSSLTRAGEELAAKGHLARPYIGLVMQPVQIPDSLQSLAGATARSGLLVVHVEAGGPADAAGVLLGDTLVDLDGHDFEDVEGLQDVLRRHAVNQDARLTLIRGGKKLELTIRIGERPLR
jgi:S1-C subfamily serine protease